MDRGDGGVAEEAAGAGWPGLERYAAAGEGDGALCPRAAGGADLGAELVDDQFAGSGFAVTEAYLQALDAVFTRERLDGLVFPQMRDQMPPLHGPGTIQETTVSEINIAGLPGVTVPAGCYASGAPFCLIFVGRQWSEADLLACAYGYEQATRYRRPPDLVMS